jgi:hypothetical protein
MSERSLKNSNWEHCQNRNRGQLGEERFDLAQMTSISFVMSTIWRRMEGTMSRRTRSLLLVPLLTPPAESAVVVPQTGFSGSADGRLLVADEQMCCWSSRTNLSWTFSTWKKLKLKKFSAFNEIFSLS